MVAFKQTLRNSLCEILNSHFSNWESRSSQSDWMEGDSANQHLENCTDWINEGNASVSRARPRKNPDVGYVDPASAVVLLTMTLAVTPEGGPFGVNVLDDEICIWRETPEDHSIIQQSDPIPAVLEDSWSDFAETVEPPPPVKKRHRRRFGRPSKHHLKSSAVVPSEEPKLPSSDLADPYSMSMGFDVCGIQRNPTAQKTVSNTSSLMPSESGWPQLDFMLLLQQHLATTSSLTNIGLNDDICSFFRSVQDAAPCAQTDVEKKAEPIPVTPCDDTKTGAEPVESTAAPTVKTLEPEDANETWECCPSDGSKGKKRKGNEKSKSHGCACCVGSRRMDAKVKQEAATGGVTADPQHQSSMKKEQLLAKTLAGLQGKDEIDKFVAQEFGEDDQTIQTSKKKKKKKGKAVTDSNEEVPSNSNLEVNEVDPRVNLSAGKNRKKCNGKEVMKKKRTQKEEKRVNVESEEKKETQDEDSGSSSCNVPPKITVPCTQAALLRSAQLKKESNVLVLDEERSSALRNAEILLICASVHVLMVKG